jgi:hypothetical protein
MDTKVCWRCHKERDIEDFALNRCRKDGRQNTCRYCKKELDKEYFTTHREKFEKYKRKQCQRAREFIEANKIPCSCGESHTAALMFHHENPREKETSIGLVINLGWSIERIKKEIAKCRVMCLNCHAKLHWELRHGSKA